KAGRFLFAGAAHCAHTKSACGRAPQVGFLQSARVTLQSEPTRTKDPPRAPPDPRPRPVPRHAFGAHAGAAFPRTDGGADARVALEGVALRGVDRGLRADRHRLRDGARAATPV